MGAREKELSVAYGFLLAACIGLIAAAPAAMAQAPLAHHGEAVPRDVREMYDRGLQYLAGKQTENGDWTDGQNGPGTTGMALMAFMASGEDPNFGRYRNHVRRALRSIISAQDGTTGYLGNSMYHHGFGMLALAEAYGAVDDRDLWPAGLPRTSGQPSSHRTIGAALELAVRSAVTSQKNNPLGRRGDTRPTVPTPTLRSAARCWWDCSRPETPASRSRTLPSIRPSPTTRA